MLISALDWQSLPERLCSRTPASTVLYRTGHSVMNYSFTVVLCVSESVKDIFRLHACLQDSSLFPTLTDHNLALNNSRLRLGTSHENKVSQYGNSRTTHFTLKAARGGAIAVMKMRYFVLFSSNPAVIVTGYCRYLWK
ncbi:hypothetical protein J6590_052611 [Homalodisca vitripennis]|nr:hypothetical protein J6590_052611 [Homalodisca vitripennis]